MVCPEQRPHTAARRRAVRGPDHSVSESDILIDDRWVHDVKHHIEHGADLPTLLMTTAHVTGNLAVLRKEWRPVDVLGVAKGTLVNY